MATTITKAGRFLSALCIGTLLFSTAGSAQKLRTLGGEQVVEIDTGGEPGLLPHVASLVSMTATGARNGGAGGAGALILGLRVGSPQFLANLQAENQSRIKAQQRPYVLPGALTGFLTIQVPSGETVRRLSRAVSISIGREEAVSFTLESSVLNQILTFSQQAGHVPPVSVELHWRGLALDLHVDGRPPVQAPPEATPRSLPVRLPPGFRLPSSLHLDVLHPSRPAERITLGDAPASIVAAANADVPYVVTQHTGSDLNNRISGLIPSHVSVTELVLPLASHDLILDHTQLAAIPAGTPYLALWLRDSRDAIWVHYIENVEPEKAKRVRMVHRAAQPFKDGLLLGFDTDLQLSTVMRVSSGSFQLDDPILRLNPAAPPGVPAVTVLRGWVSWWLRRRLAAEAGVGTTPVPDELLEPLYTSVERRLLPEGTGPTDFHAAGAVVQKINAVDSSYLLSIEPEKLAALHFKTARDWRSLRATILAVMGYAAGEMPDKADLRAAILDAVERLRAHPADQQDKQIAQLVLSRVRAHLTPEQRLRHWHGLADIVVPRDADLADVTRMPPAKRVLIDAGGILRPLRRAGDRIIVDLSGVQTPDLSFLAGPAPAALTLDLSGSAVWPALPANAFRGVERLELVLRGTGVEDEDLGFLARLSGLRSLTVDLGETRVTGAWLDAAGALERLEQFRVAMPRCARLSDDRLSASLLRAQLEALELDLEGNPQLTGRALAFVEQQTALKRAAFYLAGTQVASLPVGAAQRTLAKLAVSWPAGAPPDGLAPLRALPNLRTLAIRAQVGASPEQSVITALSGLTLTDLTLGFEGARLSADWAAALRQIAPRDSFVIDARGTAANADAARQLCAAFTGARIEVVLSAQAGCQKRR